MQAYPKREKKKKSVKPKYCGFEGAVSTVDHLDDVPRKIECPVCGRRMKPSLVDCGCGLENACHITMVLKKHRMKK